MFQLKYDRLLWSCGLRSNYEAAEFLGSRDRIPLRAWVLVSCFCVFCVGSGLCDGMTTCTEASYRVRVSACVYAFVCLCVVYVCVCVFVGVCNLETSTMRRSRPEVGLLCHIKYINKQIKWKRQFKFFLRNLQFTIYNLQFTIYNLQSIIHVLRYLRVLQK